MHFIPNHIDYCNNHYKINHAGTNLLPSKRNGLNDKEFYCYKFRSMKVNAEADTLQATKDDPEKHAGEILCVRQTSMNFLSLLMYCWET